MQMKSAWLWREDGHNRVGSDVVLKLSGYNSHEKDVHLKIIISLAILLKLQNVRHPTAGARPV